MGGSRPFHKAFEGVLSDWRAEGDPRLPADSDESSEEGAEAVAAGSVAAGPARMESHEIAAVLHGRGRRDPNVAFDALSQSCDRCLDGERAKLVRSGALKGVIGCMRAHLGQQGISAGHEAVQAVGCEALGLMAGGDDGLEQLIFDAGSIDACLAACDAFPHSEDVLGAAFQAISNVCYGGGDEAGCRRKRAAVNAGALEVMCVGMAELGLGCQWVQEAAVMAIGGLCNGVDDDGPRRRAHARALGAVDLAMKAVEHFPPAHATSTHSQAYQAACATLVRVRGMADEYTGDPLLWA